MTPSEATCGVPGCRGRAVFASCSAERTVVLCRPHLARQQPVEASPEDEEKPAPQIAACAGGRG